MTTTKRDGWTHFETPHPGPHLGKVWFAEDWPRWRWTFWWGGHAVLGTGCAPTKEEAQADLEAYAAKTVQRFTKERGDDTEKL